MIIGTLTRGMQQLYRITALVFSVILVLLGLVSLPILGPTPNTILCLVLGGVSVLMYVALGRIDLNAIRHRLWSSTLRLLGFGTGDND